MRATLLAGATLVLVAACAGSAGTQSPATSDAPAITQPPAATEQATATQTSTDAVVVGLADFVIEPSVLTAQGTTVTFEVNNVGPTPHNLSIRDANDEVLLATPDLRRGESATLSGELPAGEYTTFCSLPGHESLGMRGTLTVSGN